MSRKYLSLTLLTLPLLIGMVILFQNCSSKNSPILFTSQSKNNGGVYGGMAGKLYRSFSSVQACAANDLRGRPLPNDEIIFKADSGGVVGPFFSRQSCQDITPIAIASQDIQLDPTMTTITYQSQTFSSQNPPGAFDVAVAACPAGKSAIPGAVRTNAFASALDWTLLENGGTPGWYIFPGIDVSLNSTIESLPAYLLQRNDGALLDAWRRATQGLSLQANTDYAFTFLAQPGSVTAADFNLFRGLVANQFNPATDEKVLITFDFQAVTATIDTAININNVSAVISPLGKGFICTVYFTSSPVDDQSPVVSIGVGPSGFGQESGQLGDSIIATDAQLVPVSQFCK
jgi:hypothetical protein